MPAADHEDEDDHYHAVDQNDIWASGDDDGDNSDNDRAAEEAASESISVDGDNEAGNQGSGDMVLSEYERIRRDNIAELEVKVKAVMNGERSQNY